MSQQHNIHCIKNGHTEARGLGFPRCHIELKNHTVAHKVNKIMLLFFPMKATHINRLMTI